MPREECSWRVTRDGHGPVSWYRQSAVHSPGPVRPPVRPFRTVVGEAHSAPFSGTGALFAHFVGYAPDRIVASIPADPGHYDPVGIDNVQLPSSALGVPEFIMTGGADKICGTQRPYNYFRLYRD